MNKLIICISIILTILCSKLVYADVAYVPYVSSYGPFEGDETIAISAELILSLEVKICNSKFSFMTWGGGAFVFIPRLYSYDEFVFPWSLGGEIAIETRYYTQSEKMDKYFWGIYGGFAAMYSPWLRRIGKHHTSIGTTFGIKFGYKFIPFAFKTGRMLKRFAIEPYISLSLVTFFIKDGITTDYIYSSPYHTPWITIGCRVVFEFPRFLTLKTKK